MADSGAHPHQRLAPEAAPHPAEERKALSALSDARADVRAQADPQAQALHTDSNTIRTVQAAWPNSASGSITKRSIASPAQRPKMAGQRAM
jgi:hypothetical protein